MSKYVFINAQATIWTVSNLCRVLGVSHSRFHPWRLLGQHVPTRPDQVWVGEIAYLPQVGERRCYLATWRDACSRRVVGWHLAVHMPTELVPTALE